MAHIHFICKPQMNQPACHLTGSIYEVGDWAGRGRTKAQDAQALVGGLLFIHQTKTTPAYFIARIRDYRVVADEDNKVIFIVDAGGLLPIIDWPRPVLWCGKGAARSNDHAWSSGLQIGDHREEPNNGNLRT
jgi:hypothetical protein